MEYLKFVCRKKEGCDKTTRMYIRMNINGKRQFKAIGFFCPNCKQIELDEDIEESRKRFDEEWKSWDKNRRAWI
jgi:hypothetical protein